MATFTIHLDLKVAAHTAVQNTLDRGASPARIDICAANNTVLVRFTLTDPCGTVNGTTGQLTLTAEVSSVNALATGTAAHANICDSSGVKLIVLPAVTGISPQDDTIVLSGVAVVSGYPIELMSATLG